MPVSLLVVGTKVLDLLPLQAHLQLIRCLWRPFDNGIRELSNLLLPI